MNAQEWMLALAASGLVGPVGGRCRDCGAPIRKEHTRCHECFIAWRKRYFKARYHAKKGASC